MALEEHDDRDGEEGQKRRCKQFLKVRERSPMIRTFIFFLIYLYHNKVLGFMHPSWNNNNA